MAITGRRLDKPKAGAAQDSFPADRARRQNSHRLKALESAQDLAEAVAPRSPLKAGANARAEEKGHVPGSHSRARRAEAAEKERAAERARDEENARVEENVPAEENVANVKVAEKLWPAASVRVAAGRAAVMAAGAVIVDVVRPPSHVPRAAVRVLRPDNP